jgi:hypothetical protein
LVASTNCSEGVLMRGDRSIPASMLLVSYKWNTSNVTPWYIYAYR